LLKANCFNFRCFVQLHLFDIDTFKESDALTKGNKFMVFDINNCRIGVGICHDLRFDELSRIYRNKGELELKKIEKKNIITQQSSPRL
jgi:predicted amidohydrolase